jgi:hypothetical protein
MDMAFVLSTGVTLAEAARRRVQAIREEELHLQHVLARAEQARLAGNEPEYRVLCGQARHVQDKIDQLHEERIEFTKAVFRLRARFAS